jgi:hypothetical protein
MIKNILIFPGVLFHEIAHLLMCLALRVGVRKFKVSLFRESFVEHHIPGSIVKSFFIATAPFLLALLVSFLYMRIFFSSLLLEILKLYIVYIILYKSFPSKEDTNFHESHTYWKKIVTLPFFLILRLQYFLGKSQSIKGIYAIVVILIFYNI